MKNIFINLYLRISELIEPSSGLWNRQRLEEIFYPIDLSLILKRKPMPSQDDYWVWNHTRDGVHSIKSGNWLANQEKTHILIQEMAALPSINNLRDQIWSVQGP